ncbi:ATP-binding protein [Peribacillus frigoritolerans]|nr:ATP-binding protein [Peribacillus frigoritolerans]
MESWVQYENRIQGMGLAFVRQVAKGHGASVEIDSKLGHGTIIWIKLAEGSVSR